MVFYDIIVWLPLSPREVLWNRIQKNFKIL
nr:MAG TPA: hypothetical protein [Caudoviricetes sp.]